MEIAVAQAPHQQTQQETQQVQELGGITYLSEGAGIPILFLHGIGGAARQFAGQLRHFGQARHALAWDMPGYGGSTPLPLVTMDSLAAALGGFIGALGLDRPVLVGHSVGGMIVQRLIAEAPRVARALVLAQTSATFGGRDPAWADQFIRDRLGPLDQGHSMAELARAMAVSLVGPAADPVGVALAQDCIAHTPEATYRDTILAMPGFDMRDALYRIAVPTLVLAGADDKNAPAPAMARMAERIPGARHVVLDATGHLAHIEQPGRFNAALDSFLAGIGA